MASIIDPLLNTVDSILAWFSASLKQTTESYCDLETADDTSTLVAYDGSLASIIEIQGITQLVGKEEFNRVHEGLCIALQSSLKHSGHAFQFFFSYDRAEIQDEILAILRPAQETADRIGLDLGDLFSERVDYFAKYCAKEKTYLVLWTRPALLTNEQLRRARATKVKQYKDIEMPPVGNSQDFLAAFTELRNEHDSLVRSVCNDLSTQGIQAALLEVHDALRAVRMTVDANFTEPNWRPVLPGDTLPVRDLKMTAGDEYSDILWPSLGKQLLPRDAENLDLRTCRIGDQIYSSLFLDLFPQDIKPFLSLFGRIVSTHIPWRISFLVESDGLTSMRFKARMATILSFASQHNRLIADADKMLKYIDVNTDDAVVRLRVTLSTWAPEGDQKLLRTRAAELAKAVQGWGNCEVSETCGDPFAGAMSSALAVTMNQVSNISVAPLSEVIYMLPFTRPASPWKYGAVLLRSPDGKPWPYQPGSSQQTTWIDLIYARPGSGKSVLSNSINLGLCLAPGIEHLPRIAIIDIGPSSSGLISLIREALPRKEQYQVAHHRLLMTPEYSINPFDTQLGCRQPTPQERSFLVNFLTLLATPIGATKAYDGLSDMVGLLVDALYEHFSDQASARAYSAGSELVIDGILEEIGFVKDQHTSWWEITDALFVAGFVHEAMLAQRYAMPLLADAAAICRTHAIEDLYGKVMTPTGESLIIAFSRMISSAVREYPILSRVTAFDLGEARIVSLDLDEVAKSGGDAADRQTAVMYMLARYVLARHYFLNEESVSQMPTQYQGFHRDRLSEIREAPKRIVYDEFHRTSKAQAVRDQILLDMREGRKWNVQVALISQSVDDFDSVMVEFATSIFIMDAGPQQTIKKSAEIFGLSETAQYALKTRVHGPKEGGATFLAQFSTKQGMNTQLLTNTLGPIELWAFSTTAEDASLRNKLYKRLGPAPARKILAKLYPEGSIRQDLEKRLSALKEQQGFIEDQANNSLIDQMVEEIIKAHQEMLVSN